MYTNTAIVKDNIIINFYCNNYNSIQHIIHFYPLLEVRTKYRTMLKFVYDLVKKSEENFVDEFLFIIWAQVSILFLS